MGSREQESIHVKKAEKEAHDTIEIALKNTKNGYVMKFLLLSSLCTFLDFSLFFLFLDAHFHFLNVSQFSFAMSKLEENIQNGE